MSGPHDAQPADTQGPDAPLPDRTQPPEVPPPDRALPPGARPTDPTRPPGARADASDTGPRRFRLLVVPGTNPDRWLRVWRERLPDVPLDLLHAPAADAEAALRAGRADAAVVRLPVDRDGLSVVPLYTEDPVVVVPRDHLLTVVDEVAPDDLADETLVVPADDVLGWSDAPGGRLAGPAPATTADAVDLVAAGVGVLVTPHSLARLHHRGDLTTRPVPAAPGSPVALAWLTTAEEDLHQELVGIVRGRTAASSRGRGTGAPARVTGADGGSAATRAGGTPPRRGTRRTPPGRSTRRHAR